MADDIESLFRRGLISPKALAKLRAQQDPDAGYGEDQAEAPMTAHERLQASNRATGGPYSMAAMRDLPERAGLAGQAVQDALGEHTRSPIGLQGGSNKFDPEMPRQPLPPDEEQAAMSHEADALAAAKMRRPMQKGIDSANDEDRRFEIEQVLRNLGYIGGGVGLGALGAGIATAPFGGAGAPGGAIAGGLIGAGLADQENSGRRYMRTP